jgi:hypothetical protein
MYDSKQCYQLATWASRLRIYAICGITDRKIYELQIAVHFPALLVTYALCCYSPLKHEKFQQWRFSQHLALIFRLCKNGRESLQNLISPFHWLSDVNIFTYISLIWISLALLSIEVSFCPCQCCVLTYSFVFTNKELISLTSDHYKIVYVQVKHYTFSLTKHFMYTTVPHKRLVRVMWFLESGTMGVYFQYRGWHHWCRSLFVAEQVYGDVLTFLFQLMIDWLLFIYG